MPQMRAHGTEKKALNPRARNLNLLWLFQPPSQRTSTENIRENESGRAGGQDSGYGLEYRNFPATAASMLVSTLTTLFRSNSVRKAGARYCQAKCRRTDSWLWGALIGS